MSKKIQITIPDSLFEWIEVEAEKLSLKPSTTISFILNESRRNKENQEVFKSMMEQFTKLTPEQYSEIVKVTNDIN